MAIILTALRCIARALALIAFVICSASASTEVRILFDNTKAQTQAVSAAGLQLPKEVGKFKVIKPQLDALLNDIAPGETVALTTVGGDPLSITFLRHDVPLQGGVVHWLGKVTGQPDSYVRFTIDKTSLVSLSGPSDLRLSGVVRDSPLAMRIRPLSGGGHILYESTGDSAEPLRLTAANGGTEKRAQRLEAWGRQFDLLQQLPEASYVVGDDRLIEEFRKPALDRIGVGVFRDQTDFDKLVGELGPYLALTGSETFKFSAKIEGDQTDRYRFYQYAGGVFIADSEILVEVDKATFAVNSVSTPIVATGIVDTKPELTSEQAIDKIKDSLESRLRRVYFDSNQKVDTYLIFKRGDGDSLRLIWVVRVDDAEGQLLTAYEVDATTGKVVPAVIKKAAFFVNTCDADGVPYFTIKCDPPPKVFSPGGCVLNPDPQGKCQDPAFVVPHETAQQIQEMWEDLLGSGCCDVGMNGSLDIIVNAKMGPDWQDATAIFNRYDITIPGAPPLRGAAIYHNRVFASSAEADITSHEMGHAFWAHKSLPTYLKGAVGNTQQKRIFKSLDEGFSDLTAIILKNYKKTGNAGTGNFGTPHDWRLSPDGPDFSTPMKYPDNFDITDLQGYRNGRIFGHMFYRLVTDNNGVDFRTAATVLFGAIELLPHDDAPIVYETFRKAMLDASPSQLIKDAVKDAWNAVGTGAAHTPSSGAKPAPPVSVSGGLTEYCAPDNTTRYRLWWPFVDLASSYFIFYSYGGVWLPTGAAPLNESHVWTRINTTFKVRSCNGNGCGPMSTDGYNATYYCG